MDTNRFIRYGHEMIDWAFRYMVHLEDTKVLPNVEPGWLKSVLPKEAPERPDNIDKIIRELDGIIVPGLTHWQHRYFFSYFPSGNAWASVIGGILSNATGANGTTWPGCPVLTELECLVCDWCCRFLKLPKFFLSPYSCRDSQGMGVIQQSASEAIFYSMLYARDDALRKLTEKYGKNKPKSQILDMLIAYCNNECHHAVERAALLTCCRCRKLEPDNDGNVTADTIRQAITEDIENGLIPFFHCAILGSPGVNSTDDLMEVGPVCEEYGLWLHCDAAYSGASLACPEMRHVSQGFEYVWSANFNAHKWMLTTFDCTIHWVRYSSKAVEALCPGEEEDLKKLAYYPDLKYYQVHTTRRFRAFKLWCVIRNFGVEGLRRNCRNHINLAKLFEMYLTKDDRFEVCGRVRYGMCSFRLKGTNEVNARLLDALNYSEKLHVVSAHYRDKLVIRLALCATRANEEDVDYAWRILDDFASAILRKYSREKAQDTGLQNLYKKQILYDAIDIKRVRNSLELKESRQATVTLDDLERRIKEGSLPMLKAFKEWDIVKQEVFDNFDATLRAKPDMLEEVQYHDPNFSDQITSLMHLETLLATAENNPYKDSNISNPPAEPAGDECPGQVETA